MKLNYFLFFCLLSFRGFSQNVILNIIDPRTFSENKITLSAIADDITYIQLDNSVPLGIIYSLKLTNDFIYLSAKDAGILQFDRKGNLIRKIGRIGRGPGEYMFGRRFAIDEKTGKVFVLDPDKIKLYSKNGGFIKDLSYKDYIEYMGGDIEFYNSKLFIADYLVTGDSKFNWIILDTLGKLVARKTNSVLPFNTNTSIGGSVYQFDNKLFYYNLLNDTIFSISPDFSNKGAYLFAQGPFRWPRGKVNTDIEPWKKIFKPMKMFETNQFIVLLYSYLDRNAFALIDKKTKKTFQGMMLEENSANRKSSKPCIVNDLDGGLPLSIETNYFTSNKEEYITDFLYPFDLKTYISGNEFKNILPKSNVKKIELEKLAVGLTETDNPILVIAKLKK
jgi:hypothetical protein